MNHKLLALLLASCLIATGASVVSGDQAAPMVANDDVSSDATTGDELEDGGCDVTISDGDTVAARHIVGFDDGSTGTQDELEDGGC